MVYQVSYVVLGQKGAGKIEFMVRYPRLGELVKLQGQTYRIIQLEDLIAGKAKFCYVHALCEAA